MATQIKEVQRAGTSYPWGTWTKGAWSVKHKEDFDVEPKRFRRILIQTAYRLGMLVKTSVHPDGTVQFQFRKKPKKK